MSAGIILFIHVDSARLIVKDLKYLMKSSRDIQNVDSVVCLADCSIYFFVYFVHKSHPLHQSPVHYSPRLHLPQGFLKCNIMSV